MRISPFVTLLASVVIGAVALFAARGWLAPSEADAIIAAEVEIPEEPELISVVVAKRNIPRSAPIDENWLEIQEWPILDVPEGAFQSYEDIGSTEFLKRRAMMPIDAGQPILEEVLSELGLRPSLAARLEPGYRAFTVRMSDVTGVGGFVLPGDRIDILLTREDPWSGDTQTMLSEVILQDVEVLGLDLNDDLTTETPTEFSTATVAVSISDAQKLTLAAETGTVWFVLRGSEDHVKQNVYTRRQARKANTSETLPQPGGNNVLPKPNANEVRINVIGADNSQSYNVPRS